MYHWDQAKIMRIRQTVYMVLYELRYGELYSDNGSGIWTFLFTTFFNLNTQFCYSLGYIVLYVV